MSKCEEKENKMGTLRNDKWRHVWPFFTIMLLHCVAILLFTRGFLLTRTELPHFSHCSDISKCPCFSSSSPSPLVGDTEVEEEDLTAATRRPDLNVANQSHQQTRCWTRPAVDRLIIIVLDALRFDFVAPSTFFEEKRPWMDKLPVLQELASRQGSSTKIFKAIADPPTTSLQRLKGLTTGGLPTFIDVGNSFGAPAILEDNLIYQLAQNGKRVLMMGDDTWLQLFPHHFEKSYPFPSFNVKDLHTVDNGCIDHLFPSLYQEDWDVLIAHFLGVDHAGHIYGVDSSPMIEKLEQYNGIIDKVVEVLKSHSGPGGLHENTFLVVMGDHGQTLNGDHGGGTAEEVETSIFAMSLKDPPCSIPAELDTSFCKLDLDGNELCIGTFQQLDFAVTISALLGIPFPFASIGHVNPQLYALAAGTWNPESSEENKCHHKSNLRGWMQSYLDVLCINAWQVKRFIDVYSASSVIGFSSEDISRIGHMYTLAADSQSLNIKDSLYGNETQFPVLKRQIDAYFALLESVADLARSKWTEFDLRMMAVGFGVMLTSLVIHYVAIKRAYDIYRASFPTLGNSGISSGLVLAIFVVAVRACSFLSNSYILEEGKVAIFLLATTGIANIRHSIMKMKMAFEVVLLLKLISVLRFSIDLGPAKQGIGSAGTLNSDYEGHLSVYMAEIVPMLALFLLAYLLYKTTQNSSCWGISKCVILGSILSYVLIAIYWVIECKKLNLPPELQSVGKSRIPQTIYGIGLGQLVLLTLDQLFSVEKTTDSKGRVFVKTVAMLSAWSSTVIILLGKQGPTIALASIIGGWCIMTLQSLEGNEAKDGTSPVLTFNPLSVTQWSLFAVCLFFCTGHWCAFDGLRYGAAFIGFDEFILIRQAILLTIDTFGFSHILPIFGLPVLLGNNPFSQYNLEKQSVFLKLSFVYLMYGLIMATSVTFTIICVTIHRRHLMVWGLFAPKFVFDVVGLVLTDALICMASLYYF